ncbi:agamous-like MADS-box protein AGL62 [Prosopis cineraria]|uniref:agamous-like MADS-box protein AGL62 n=1 Tax=Prosopis cineraria TaxID=364024 RepID=UPI00241097EC|nr:agamous-like MADS-box protein AGL62 [Prosopis cineraria]
MTSSSSTISTKNTGKGRRKIEIKKVEQTSKRLVTFSKRKLGLFRKAAELSLLCNAEIAVVVFSQHGKVYSSGYPDPDSVIHRYLAGTFSSGLDSPSVDHDQDGESAVSSSSSLLRREYEEAMKVLEDEKKSLDATAEIPGSGCGQGSWWNRPVGEMGLEEVVEFKERVEQLRQNLVVAAEEEKKKQTAMTSPISLPPLPHITESTMETEESLYHSLLNDDVFDMDRVWDWDFWNKTTNSNNSSMVWNSDLSQSY